MDLIDVGRIDEEGQSVLPCTPLDVVDRSQHLNDVDFAPYFSVRLTPTTPEVNTGTGTGNIVDGTGNLNTINNQSTFHYHLYGNDVSPSSGPTAPITPPSQHNEVHDRRPDESPTQTYVRLLLKMRHGYPLWRPGPPKMENEEEDTGIRLGDVGFLQEDGLFCSLFNVCGLASDVVNARYRLPTKNFTPGSSISAEEYFFNHNDVIATSSILTSSKLYNQNDLQLGHAGITRPIREFSFTSKPGAMEGAFLVLPNGADRSDFHPTDLPLLETYVRQYAIPWFKRLQLYNRADSASRRSLYLITGYDKCDNWCLASSSNILSDTGVSLSFVPYTVNSGGIVLYEYQPCAGYSAPINRRAFNGQQRVKNQSVFIRGYRITWRRVESSNTIKKPVVTVDIMTEDSSTAASGGVAGGPPCHQPHSGTTGFSANNGSIPDQQRDQEDPDVVEIKRFPDSSETCHPLDSVNDHLLSQNRSAWIAVTHDNHLRRVIKESDDEIPDGPILLQRILETYHPIQQDGCVTLVEKDSAALEGSMSDVGIHLSVIHRENTTHENEPAMANLDEVIVDLHSRDDWLQQFSPNPVLHGWDSIPSKTNTLDNPVTKICDTHDMSTSIQGSNEIHVAVPSEDGHDIVQQRDMRGMKRREILGDILLLRFERFGDLTDIDKCISTDKDVLQLSTEDHPDAPRWWNNLGYSLLTRFQRSGELGDIEEAISAHKHAVGLTPEDHTDKPGRLNNLGNSFLTRFQRSGEFADIEEAISAQKHAVRLTPEGHPDKPTLLNSLGNAFATRFEHSGELADIEYAIYAHKSTVDMTPEGHVDNPAHLSNLGNSFLARFKRSGEFADLEEAISAQKRAVGLTPEGHPDKPTLWNNLGNSFAARFERSGETADIEIAISAHKHAVYLTPEGHVGKPRRFGNLGNSFLTRFKHWGELADIEEAISAHKHAVRLTPDGHADKPTLLNNLGNSFATRFERLGELADIEQAISTHNHAVRLTPEGHADKPTLLNNLGNSFATRFERLGELADIEQAISANKHAVDLTPEDHTNKPAYLSNLGSSFLTRSERSGELTDIEQAISANKHAVDLTPEGHTNKPAYLSNLGSSFLTRFERSGELTDIEQAISANKHAVDLTPEGHTNKPAYLSNLGSSFLTRFERSGELTDIEQAISANKHAVDLTPEGHTNKPAYLSNLGSSFLTRFERSGELTDIEQAISANKHAVDLTPEGHTNKPAYLSNLGSSFLSRFERSGELTDIEQAISANKHAVDLTPDGHVSKPQRLTNLGNSFSRRFDRFHEPTDLDAALGQFRSSSLASTGPPLVRYRSACQWARLASATRSVTSFDAYSAAIGLLRRIAWLELTTPQRHKVLAAVGDIGSEAAAAAIQLGRFDTALEWLETARSIVWGQLLNLRTPVDKLRSVLPQLADELARISQELDNAGTRDSHSPLSNQPISESMEQAAVRHYQLAQQWDSLVEQVRGVPGFKDFLRPKQLPQLLKAAQYGPVITINVHQSRCDCLALVPGHDDVIHIPLPHFSYKQSLNLRDSLHESLLIAKVHGPKPPPTIGAGVRSVLSTLWYTVAKPVLGSLGFGVANVEDPPRIWWCLTGPMTSLPLHAAGVYDAPTPGFKVTDFVTSSYTPTLTTLIETSRHSRTSFAGLLAIGQPNTPGKTPLPNAAEELSAIQSLGSSDFHVHSLLGDQATVEDVVKGMMECSWVHFACHGLQDVSEPNRSAFYLHDGELTLSRIISTSFPHADFAFLSSCQTAEGDDKLSGEAAHLAGGMIVAGYRSVIATMWPIQDKHAPVVASEVYRRLACGSSPDSSRAAHALHHAVQNLREQLGNDSDSSFLSWLPFIHVGI